MNFAKALEENLSNKNLLKHEFYQAWSAGTIPVETLQLYARQYYHHVKAFPRYISATHSNCEDIQARQLLLENLTDEESGSENHPELWLRFAEGLGESRINAECETLMPATQNLIQTFMGFAKNSYAEGLGALFAYEHQIPEIAKFKKDALKNFYSIDSASALSFFEVHEKADIYHTDAIRGLLDKLTPEQKVKAETAAQQTADHLWKFLDAIQDTVQGTVQDSVHETMPC